MVGMLGPHKDVPIRIVKAKGGGFLVVQRNPVHGWNDQLSWVLTRREAEAEKAKCEAMQRGDTSWMAWEGWNTR
jgi:hypothetical protein